MRAERIHSMDFLYHQIISRAYNLVALGQDFIFAPPSVMDFYVLVRDLSFL